MGLSSGCLSLESKLKEVEGKFMDWRVGGGATEKSGAVFRFPKLIPRETSNGDSDSIGSEAGRWVQLLDPARIAAAASSRKVTKSPCSVALSCPRVVVILWLPKKSLPYSVRVKLPSELLRLTIVSSPHRDLLTVVVCLSSQETKGSIAIQAGMRTSLVFIGWLTFL